MEFQQKFFFGREMGNAIVMEEVRDIPSEEIAFLLDSFVGCVSFFNHNIFCGLS